MSETVKYAVGLFVFGIILFSLYSKNEKDKQKKAEKERQEKKKKNEKTCPVGRELKNGVCVIKCPVGKELKNGACVIKCPVGKELKNGACVIKCPVGKELKNGACVIKCPVGEEPIDGICVIKCPAGVTRVDGECVIKCPAGSKPMNGVCTAPVDNPAHFCPAGKAVNVVSGTCHAIPEVTVDATDADKELSFTNLNNNVCIPWNSKHSDGSEMYKRVNSKVEGQSGNVYEVAKIGSLRWKLPIANNDNATNYFLDEFSGPVYYKSTDSRPRWFGKQPLVTCPSDTKYVIGDE